MNDPAYDFFLELLRWIRLYRNEGLSKVCIWLREYEIEIWKNLLKDTMHVYYPNYKWAIKNDKLRIEFNE